MPKYHLPRSGAVPHLLGKALLQSDELWRRVWQVQWQEGERNCPHHTEWQCHGFWSGSCQFLGAVLWTKQKAVSSWRRVDLQTHFSLGLYNPKTIRGQPQTYVFSSLFLRPHQVLAVPLTWAPDAIPCLHLCTLALCPESIPPHPFCFSDEWGLVLLEAPAQMLWLTSLSYSVPTSICKEQYFTSTNNKAITLYFGKLKVCYTHTLCPPVLYIHTFYYQLSHKSSLNSSQWNRYYFLFPNKKAKAK